MFNLVGLLWGISMLNKNTKSICKYRSKYVVFFDDLEGKEEIVEYEYKEILSINVLSLQP